MTKPEEISESEVYRYLGYDEKKHIVTDDMRLLIKKCIALMLDTIEPKVTVSPVLPVVREEEEVLVGSCRLSGKDIAAHLDKCREAVFMAATLGNEIDTLIRRTETLNMAEAVILDAAANVAIEQVCQTEEDRIREEIIRSGKYLTMRFSPGYGDLPIETQHEFLRMLDAPRKIGLSVTSSHIMTPRKSITSIMGIADIYVKGKLAGCGNCVMKDKCIFRKRGTTCV